MKNFDVQSVSLPLSAEKAFAFIAAPENLPKWASAFKSADRASAVLRTPRGEMPIRLRVDADPGWGIIDWHMTMPDGSVGRAHSRVVPNGPNESIYSFVLHAPPVPLERLEGVLAEQIATLSEELRRLAELLKGADSAPIRP